MFIENTAAVEITMSAVKTEAVIYRDKFEVKQHGKVLTPKKLFPNEHIIEEYFALHYRTDFTFKKHILVVKIDEKGHADRDPDYKKKRQKELEKLGYYFIRINPDKKGFNDYEQFGRVSAYIAESIKNKTEKSTKKLLIDDLSKILLE